MNPRSRIIKVLCTLGPASLNRETIERLQSREVDLFRINLSHTPLGKVAETIDIIRAYSSVPICLDTEGAQVRTGPMRCDTAVDDRQRIKLVRHIEEGTGSCFMLTPPSVFNSLEPNTLIGVDFDGVVLLVLGPTEDGVDTVVLNGGKIGSNKAVIIDPAPDLPPLSEKDIAAVKIGIDKGITHYALSFANCAADVHMLRNLVGPDASIISKIESKRGVRNIDEILGESDEILIDRGDLSREVPLENIPLLQKSIVRKASSANIPVNVATNLLESMIVNRKPTRAELNDIVNTILDGANGLVLAAETAIGSHPVETVDIILGLIERYRRSLEGYRIEDLLEGGSVLLPSLHGGLSSDDFKLPRRWRSSGQTISNFASIEVNLETAMDIEQIAHGVYSPLQGFMTQAELERVLTDHRLLNGQVWTMPIVLQGESRAFAPIQPGQSIRLIDPRSGEATAVLHVEDKYEVDIDDVTERWFGTADREHPGVARFVNGGAAMLGGPIEFLGPAKCPRSPYQLTPAQTRMLFDIKGWTKIIAFHTRNVPHRGHEHVLAHARERCNADGILIHPVIGPKKTGDFTAEAILNAYERLVSDRIPHALLAAFSTYSRYCGPREAVFTALCRKNYGCTHFALGRDHTGVGGFYAPDDNRLLFESLGDIGITPVYFDSVHYSIELEDTIEGAAGNSHLAISGTMIRDLLVRDEQIPEWCMRRDISELLLEMQRTGRPVIVQ